MQDLKAQFWGKITRDAFLALEPEHLVFHAHQDNSGTDCVILLGSSDQFYIDTEMHEFEDWCEVGVIRIKSANQAMVDQFLRDPRLIIVGVSGCAIDVMDVTVNNVEIETGLQLARAGLAIRILPAIMPTQLVVQRVGDAKGIAYDGAKVGPERDIDDHRISPRR